MYRILIADDEKIERLVLYRALEKNLKERCRIFQAENGREALEVYEREKIQILILDIEMPGINGIQAAEKVREKDKECCIIFLTAFDEFSYAKKAITVRALDYLLKPCDESEMMLVLEEAMRLTDEHEKNIRSKNGSEGEVLPEYLFAESEPEDTGKVRMDKVTEMIFRYIQNNYMYDISM